jgi:glycine cleavage system H lipoate-binding protein/CheY-like chemotaxis protein
LRLLGETGYDVVITDLMMHHMDGLELMRRLQDLHTSAQVVVLTGYPTIQTALQAKHLGAFEYVTKPFTRQELLSVVIRALRSTTRDAAGGESPLEVLDQVYLLPDHSWARPEPNGKARIGMARGFASGVGKVAAIGLPAVNDVLEQGRGCISFRAEDGIEHILYSPLSGRVAEVNAAVLKDPGLASSDPEGTGWLLLLLPENLDRELQNLTPRS